MWWLCLPLQARGVHSLVHIEGEVLCTKCGQDSTQFDKIGCLVD